MQIHRDLWLPVLIMHIPAMGRGSDCHVGERWRTQWVYQSRFLMFCSMLLHVYVFPQLE